MKQVIQLPEPLTVDELMAQIHSNSMIDYEFHQLRNDFQTFFIDICTGKKNLPFTLDPFFKHIFDVDAYPERLASFLSAILNQPVTVEQILPNQHGQLVEGGTFIIMDIIVRLADGSIVNVEIQRNPYQFQGERLSCYSADLVMRQYQQIHSKTNSGYKDMKPVYSIVLYETSSANFKNIPDQYIHRSGWRFDTGLQLNMLQQFICIPLDSSPLPIYTKVVLIVISSIEDTCIVGNFCQLSMRIYWQSLTEYYAVHKIYSATIKGGIL